MSFAETGQNDIARYVFYPTADAAQDRIWSYTADVWGEDQAEKYIRELHVHLCRLAENPSIWRSVRFPSGMELPWKGTVFMSRFQHHILFFRPLSEGVIGIVSILHAKMDLPAALAKDLETLLKRSHKE